MPDIIKNRRSKVNRIFNLARLAGPEWHKTAIAMAALLGAGPAGISIKMSVKMGTLADVNDGPE